MSDYFKFRQAEILRLPAPETPAEVESLLEKMKEEGVTIGTTLENAELLAAAVLSRHGE